MKKLLIILSLIVGCGAPPKVIPEIQLIIDIDFTEYTQKGFLFTPNAYTANYESIGLITIIYYPEARLVTRVIEYEGKDKEGNKRARKESEWVINKINSNALLDSVYTTCIEMGADAFTQLKILDAPTMPYGINTTNPIIS